MLVADGGLGRIGWATADGMARGGVSRLLPAPQPPLRAHTERWGPVQPPRGRAQPQWAPLPLMSMSCSSDSGWLLTGSVPFSAMYFSISRRS